MLSWGSVGGREGKGGGDGVRVGDDDDDVTFGLFLVGTGSIDAAGNLVKIEAGTNAVGLSGVAAAVGDGVAHAVQLRVLSSVWGD